MQLEIVLIVSFILYFSIDFYINVDVYIYCINVVVGYVILEV